MLVITQSIKTPSVKRLTKFWMERYIHKISFHFPQDQKAYCELVELASPKGRLRTTAKLETSLVDVSCQMAGILAKELYENVPNVLNLKEARHLTQFVCPIYIKLLEMYKQPSVSNISQTSMSSSAADSSLGIWGIPNPDIEQLAKELKPALLEFQEQHIGSKDWRALGFMTTLLNFTNKLLLYKLTPIEQILITPYFKFVEEQVAVPWERVCAAAAKHQPESKALILVEKLLPNSDRIAESVYENVTRLFPNHKSRRGGLSDPGVAHSCLRDLNMFQAYLWLSVLEESMEPVENELVSLCVMVMQSVGVSWELTAQWIELLIAEINSRLLPEQCSLLQPYTEGMRQAFIKQRSDLSTDTALPPAVF